MLSRFRRTTKDPLWSCIHSFPTTCLANNLKPRSTAGKLEIALRERSKLSRRLPFARDAIPRTTSHFPHSGEASRSFWRRTAIRSVPRRGAQCTIDGSAEIHRNCRGESSWPRSKNPACYKSQSDGRAGHPLDRGRRHLEHLRIGVSHKIYEIRSGRSDQTCAPQLASNRLSRRVQNTGWPRSKVHNSLPEAFYPISERTTPPHQPQYQPSTQDRSQLPTHFTSPPLMPGLLSSLKDVIGSNAKPTPIQALSLKHLFGSEEGVNTVGNKCKQILLASETGSGKSIAYLLPVLQALKVSELRSRSFTGTPLPSLQRSLNPRALILAPTHELSRQLAGFAKALLHAIKLRVVCASRANARSYRRTEGTASKMAEEYGAIRGGESETREFDMQRGTKTRPVDVVVGTPMKVLEMTRGRGWDQEPSGRVQHELDFNEKGRKIRSQNVRKGEPEMGLTNVEWVIVDEADVLFDPDFQESTRMLLADISMARGHPIPYSPMPALSPNTPVCIPALPSTLEYPFNFLLASATIPSSLATYLDIHHPTLTRLASPNLHHLPKSLQTEYVSWTGGNRNADVERQIRRVWADDASSSKAPTVRSKMLVFCNKSTKVEDLGKFLEGKGIRNIALTSSSDSRKKGSNHHLDGFLGKPFNEQGSTTSTLPAPSENVTHSMAPKSAIPAEEPHVMITTSLLSRGLDFSPAIRHVLIVDEPRNMIDFLHRAGRTGRAGERGKVIVFGKLKGRGSDKAWEVRRKVAALAQRA